MDGKEDSPGICNLRDIQTGQFVEFGEGFNGFVRKCAGKYTQIHRSTEFKNVLIKANILDATEDPAYFVDLIRKFSHSDEKVIAIMDVNATILSVDSVCSKNMTAVLLGTMAEFISVEPKGPCVVEWDQQLPVNVNRAMTLKDLVKKIANH